METKQQKMEEIFDKELSDVAIGKEVFIADPDSAFIERCEDVDMWGNFYFPDEDTYDHYAEPFIEEDLIYSFDGLPKFKDIRERVRECDYKKEQMFMEINPLSSLI